MAILRSALKKPECKIPLSKKGKTLFRMLQFQRKLVIHTVSLMTLETEEEGIADRIHRQDIKTRI